MEVKVWGKRPQVYVLVRWTRKAGYRKKSEVHEH